MLLGGNPPFQPQVVVSNGIADNPGGAGGAASLPFGMTAIDPVFKHPTSYMWSAGVQREIPLSFIMDVTYVGRRGLYLQRERDINQLLPGTVQANPGVNIAALRPYKGYGAIRLSENAGYSKYNSLQISAERRYKNGFKFSAAYTLGHSEDNASDKRDVLFNTYDDTGFWGNSSFDRRHVFSVLLHLRPAVLQDAGGRDRQGARRLADLGRDVHAHGHAVLGHARARTSPAPATPSAIPWNLNGDPKANANEAVLGRHRQRPELLVRPDGVLAPGGRHLRQRAAEQHLQPRPVPVGHRAVQERQRRRNEDRRSSAPRSSTSSTTRTGTAPTPTRPTRPSAAITGKDNSRRDIQLSLRFQF